MTDFAYVGDKQHRDALLRYAAPFVSQLLRGIGPVGKPAQVLELFPGDGTFSFAVLRLLPLGSRLVAIAEESASLDTLHQHRRAALGVLDGQLFARRDELTRLPFAPAVFDIAYHCGAFAPLNDPKTLLATALRLLRPEGRLVLVQPLRNSLFELTQATAQTLPPGHEDTLARLLAERQALPDLEELAAQATRAGAVVGETWQERLVLEVHPKDPLVTRVLVPLYLGDPDKIGLLARNWLTQILKKPTQTTVHIGGLSLRRGHVPMEMD